jgi:hypothetical protein
MMMGREQSREWFANFQMFTVSGINGSISVMVEMEQPIDWRDREKLKE